MQKNNKKEGIMESNKKNIKNKNKLSATNKNTPESPQRRQFLSNTCALTVTGVTAGLLGSGALLTSKSVSADEFKKELSKPLRALEGEERQEQVYKLRKQAAKRYRKLPPVVQINNGDDAAYTARIGSFTKGMPHNGLGEVDKDIYATYLQAIETGDRDLFDTIPTPGNITLRNIENIWSIDYLGPDSHSLTIPPAPAIASAEHGGEFVELYWKALTRDVPFADYSVNADIQAAISDMNKLSDFRGPKENGQVTTDTLFRGAYSGDLEGPYISQFLAVDIPYGAMLVPQKTITAPFGQDYITSYNDWVNQQNGNVAKQKTNDPVHRYLRSGRDLGEYVGRDFLYQPYLNAALILTRGLKLPFDSNNPYIKPGKSSQHGHNTFGGHHLYHMVVRIANIAQKHAWYHKWAVHRRLRPEEYGGRVHNHMVGDAVYPMPDDLLNSDAIQRVIAKWGSYLLPQQYPEGVPPHPAYPAGHATIAGACTTMLKALMNEDTVLSNPVVSNVDGTELDAYTGGDTLTVGGELNKLAANISIGRDFAGVHWRSDSIEGMLLGEEVAINVLRDLKLGYYEEFKGFHLTKFDGTQIII